MEVCVPCIESSCHDGCSNGGSLKNSLNTTKNTSAVLSVSDLQTCLNEVLIKVSGTDDTSSVMRENELKEKDLQKNKSAPEKCFSSRCSTFPPVPETRSSVDGLFSKEKHEDTTDAVFDVNGLVNSVNQSGLQSISLPTPPKLLSALKGSCEKQGLPPKKLSVTWAPDVYDPIPTSVSHVPTSSKNHHYRSYGKRKIKQKRGGKSSQSSSKDRQKKETRRIVGTSYKHKPVLDYDSGIVPFSSEPVARTSVENQNPFCGSSLLKDSVMKLHFSGCRGHLMRERKKERDVDCQSLDGVLFS